jgi:hypothetical protein
MLSLHFAMSLRHVYATKVELSIKAMRIMLTKQLIKYAINYDIYKNSATIKIIITQKSVFQYYNQTTLN